MSKTAVELIGHGAPALDCPPYDVFKLRQLTARRRALGGAPTEEEQEIERRVREFPRTPDNDPYRAGLEAVAAELRGRVTEETAVALAFSEYCDPTLEQAVGDLVGQGYDRIVVVPSMMTPGGVHSERDVPDAIHRIAPRFPSLQLEYAWPFDSGAVADLLAEQLSRKSDVPRR
jgi:sirohydrochlorin cobaltochelatase